MNEHIVIVTGAAFLPEHVVSAIPPSAIVLGVDGGLDIALRADLRPSGLIGARKGSFSDIPLDAVT